MTLMVYGEIRQRIWVVADELKKKYWFDGIKLNQNKWLKYEAQRLR